MVSTVSMFTNVLKSWSRFNINSTGTKSFKAFEPLGFGKAYLLSMFHYLSALSAQHFNTSLTKCEFEPTTSLLQPKFELNSFRVCPMIGILNWNSTNGTTKAHMPPTPNPAFTHAYALSPVIWQVQFVKRLPPTASVKNDGTESIMRRIAGGEIGTTCQRHTQETGASRKGTFQRSFRAENSPKATVPTQRRIELKNDLLFGSESQLSYLTKHKLIHPNCGRHACFAGCRYWHHTRTQALLIKYVTS